MKKFALIALALAAAAPGVVMAQTTVEEGVMVYDADGKRLAAVYRADEAGNAQLILGGKMRVVPAATLTATEDGKLSTSLTRRDLMKQR